MVRAVTGEEIGDPAWAVGAATGMIEVENKVTIEVGWAGAGAWAWAGDEATGAGACTAA